MLAGDCCACLRTHLLNDVLLILLSDIEEAPLLAMLLPTIIKHSILHKFKIACSLLLHRLTHTLRFQASYLYQASWEYVHRPASLEESIYSDVDASQCLLLFYVVHLSAGETEEPQPAVAAAVGTAPHARPDCIRS